jgi:purine catabolism regulator
LRDWGDGVLHCVDYRHSQPHAALDLPEGAAIEHVFALSDLLSEESLGLSPLTGGPASRARRVSGAHAIETEHPARWLAPDWVMLTTGVALRGHPDTQRTLIEELEAAHISALGFGVGVVFKRIPPALLEEANRRAYPLFEIPLKTPFREVISSVHRSLAGCEMRTYQRLSSIQRYLIEALTHDDPQRTLLERVGRVLDATVILFGVDGEPLVPTGEAPTNAVWQGVSRHRHAFIAEFDAGGWHTVAAPVARADELSPLWLAVTSPHAGFSAQLAKVAVQATTPLLVAIGRLDDLAVQKERAVRSGLLDEALASSRGSEGRALALHSAALGIDFAGTAYVIVVQARSGVAPERDSTALATLRAELETELKRARVPHLVTERCASVVALVQQERCELGKALATLTAAHPEVVVGIGRVVREIAAVEHSFRDAQLVIACLRRGSGAAAPVAEIADLDLATVLISEVSEERLRPKVEEYLGPLRATRDLYETLIAYFAHDLDIVATAQSMHVHPNTLRYRLARVEKTIGHSLKQPATIAALHIVLVSASVNESR